MKQTKPTVQKTITRAWHVIDLKNKILGRESTQIAQLLMGKGKPYFVRHLDVGDYVVVVNAAKVKLTGKKEEQKKYYRYSGYPGGMTIETAKEKRARKPEDIIMHAVKGMLPQNRLRDRMLRRLKVFPGETHTYEEKMKGKGQSLTA